MPTKKPTRSELKRQSIIDAAKKAFQENGVQGTSMDKLAELAQVSKRTVYNHFETKEALVMHLITELWQQAMVDIEFEYQANEPLKPQLETIINSEIELISCDNYINLVRVAFGHFFYHPEALQKEMEKIASQETALHRWLINAKEDGRLSFDDPELATKQLHNLIKGSCFWPQMMKMQPTLSDQEQQKLSKESVAMFLSHYETT
jgi:TetR/AcrR family transcriptional regulator of autoinduction and epiphytic fitness